MNSPCIDYRHNLESRACGYLIHGPSKAARAACAQALRAWKYPASLGQLPAMPDRAKWFLNHVYFVGYPAKS